MLSCQHQTDAASMIELNHAHAPHM